MIKTVLLHYIYEFGLNIMFDNFGKNFHSRSKFINPEKLTIGQYIQCSIYGKSHAILLICKVEAIESPYIKLSTTYKNTLVHLITESGYIIDMKGNLGELYRDLAL